MFCLPSVAEADYPDLERFLRPHVPLDFAGWRALCGEWTRQHEREGILPVEINLPAFVEYMTNVSRPLDIGALLDYAAFIPWHDPD